MKIIYSTDIGRMRSENQDAVWCAQQDDTYGLAVVCDGMGGANGGRQASSMVVETIKRMVETEPFDGSDIRSFFQNMIDTSNRLVYEAAEEDNLLAGMGTTLVMAFVNDKKAYFANVGDSRGYYITNGSISQITKDHSAVQELVDSGHLTERQAKKHPNKNIITRAIGIEPNISFDYYEVPIKSGDIIILCSDGLTNYLDENEIQFEAFGGDFNSLPQRMIDLANNRGGSDNITVAAIQL